jgi:cell division protein FtsB
MTSVSVPTSQRRGQAAGPTEPSKARFAARRRIVIVVVLCALAALAVGANYGPLTHYLDAKARLETRTAEVATLESRNAELQSTLSKLLQPGYLEQLARQELTYSLPDEDLYIITGGAANAGTDRQSGGFGVGALVPLSDAASDPGLSSGTAAGSDAATDSSGAVDEPGFLERLLSRIAHIF